MSETFLIRDLVLGARRHLSELVAQSIDQGGPEVIDFEVAGDLLATALSPLVRPGGETQPPLPLVAATLEMGQQQAELTPSAALGDPTFGRWLGPTWPGFIGSRLRSGATLDFLMPDAPQAQHAEVRDQDGDLAVRVTSVWPAGTLYASYGCRARYGLVVCLTQVPCAQLMVLGAELGEISRARAAAGVSPLRPQGRKPSPVATCQTVH